MRSNPLVAISLIFLAGAGLARAENWPQWRGPRGTGTSGERGLPAEWTRTRNVAWRLPLPGPAGSTPAFWGDRLFLTSAEGDDLVLLAVSSGGKELWKRKLGAGNRTVRGDEGNYASASPSTDGKNVWAYVGSGDLACFDFEGREVWKVNLQERHGRYEIQFGMTSTPVLDGDLLYLQAIQSKDPYILALDKMTGKDRWKRSRRTEAQDECEHSYASPILYRDPERALLLVHGADWLTAHRLNDGSEVWRSGELNGPGDRYNNTLRLIASPLASPGMIVVPSAKGGPVHCIRPDGQGDVTRSHRIWSRPKHTPDVPTPAIEDGLVYLLRENGVLTCVEASSGNEVYEERTHIQRHRASPVVADGKVYCASTDGTVTVVRAGRRFEVLGTNTIEEHLSATPVAAGGRLYLRSYQALYAIQAPPEEEEKAGGGK